MSFKDFVKELNGSRVEGDLIKTAVYALFTGFATLVFLYLIALHTIENVIPDYGLFIFFSILSYALICLSVRQIQVYRELPCMSGMMVGMTTGMISGFLPGFYVAATNGMFIGGFFGVAIGIIFGIWNGKCCGVMGFMEGMMAGFMGGLMGAMTAFMLINDHLQLSAFLVFLISAVITIGLTYMIYTETKEHQVKRKENHFFTIMFMLIMTSVTVWLIVFGPRSGLFS